MLTIPFFVLAGAVVAGGGMAKRLVDFAAVTVAADPHPSSEKVNVLSTRVVRRHLRMIECAEYFRGDRARQ